MRVSILDVETHLFMDLTETQISWVPAEPTTAFFLAPAQTGIYFYDIGPSKSSGEYLMIFQRSRLASSRGTSADRFQNIK